ncbi:MAG: 4Fe-4S binding protein [Candidatus Hadarchaeales archaeon]
MGLKIKEIGEALRSAASKPFTVRYPFVPSPPPETFRGKPEFNDKCMGCGACEMVCPAGAITVEDGELRRIQVEYGRCIRCGQCARLCPVEGIKLTTGSCVISKGEEERTRTSVERKLLRCEECGAPITAREHMGWMLERLGPLSFSNPTLVKFSQLLLGEAVPETESPFRLLCPRCRRMLVLSEHGWRTKY